MPHSLWYSHRLTRDSREKAFAKFSIMHYLVFFGTLLLLALFDLRELSLVEANVDKDADACSLRPKSPHPRLGKAIACFMRERPFCELFIIFAVRFTLDPRETTVSGISNGGAFATHISFIYSSLIHGAGIFAASMWRLQIKFAVRIDPFRHLSPTRFFT